MEEFSTIELRSKKILMLMFVSFCVADLALMFVLNDYSSGLIRIFLTIALMCFVLMGHRWAKWLMVVLFGLAVLMALALGVYIVRVNVSVGAALIFSGIVFSGIPIYLVFNKNVNSYLLKVKRYKKTQKDHGAQRS